jgi:hypothetical protein
MALNPKPIMDQIAGRRRAILLELAQQGATYSRDRYVPVRTGYLQSRIQAAQVGDDARMVNDAAYAWMVERRTPYMMRGAEDTAQDLDAIVARHQL